MSGVEEFITAPSYDLFEGFTKAQLLQVAAHYKLAVASEQKKVNILYLYSSLTLYSYTLLYSSTPLYPSTHLSTPPT